VAVQERACSELARVASAFALFLAGQSAGAAPYYEVTLDSVHVIAPERAERAEGVARHLLFSEHALVQLTGLEPSTSRPRTQVVCLTKRDYSFVKDDDLDARIYVDDGRTLSVLKDCPLGKHGLRPALTSHTRSLLDHGSLRNYPIWYGAGFEELMSASYLTPPDLISVGSVAIAATYSIRLKNSVPARELFETDGWTSLPFGERMLRYGRAWTFVQHSVVKGRDGQQRLNAMASAVAGGMAPESALEAHFAVNYEQLDRLLNEHLRSRPMVTRVRIPAELVSAVPAASEVAPERVTEILRTLQRRESEARRSQIPGARSYSMAMMQ
jgi:hypothetical protein